MVAHLAPIAAIGAGVVGLGLVLASAKKASAAVHPNTLGLPPSVKGTTGGTVAPVPNGFDPSLVTKPPVNLSTLPTKIVPTPLPSSPAGNPISVLTTPGDPSAGRVTFKVATMGKAVPQAHALYDYLVKNGPHSDGTSAFTDLTKAFQVVHNSDPDAVLLTTQHKIPEDGTYDALTSGALTLYTGHPIAQNPVVPPPAPMTNAQISDPARTEPVQSPAAYSSFALYSYLKQHGNDKSATLKPLVKAFQHDVNTDPVFPGPVSYSGVKVIKTPLVEDGLYGTGTYNALKCVTMDTPKP